jgi:hypothetical protein
MYHPIKRVHAFVFLVDGMFDRLVGLFFENFVNECLLKKEDFWMWRHVTLSMCVRFRHCVGHTLSSLRCLLGCCCVECIVPFLRAWVCYLLVGVMIAVLVYIFVAEYVLWLFSEAVAWTPMFYLRGANVSISVVTTKTEAPTVYTIVHEIPGAQLIEKIAG